MPLVLSGVEWTWTRVLVTDRCRDTILVVTSDDLSYFWLCLAFMVSVHSACSDLRPLTTPTWHFPVALLPLTGYVFISAANIVAKVCVSVCVFVYGACMASQLHFQTLTDALTIALKNVIVQRSFPASVISS